MKSLKLIVIALAVFVFCFSACDNGTTTTPEAESETSGSDTDSSSYESIDIYNTYHTCSTRVLARGEIGSGILDEDSTFKIGEIEDATLSATALSSAGDGDTHHYVIIADALSNANREFSAISQVHSWGDVTVPEQTNIYLAESDITSNIFFKAISSSSSTTRIHINVDVAIDVNMKCLWPDTGLDTQAYIDFDTNVSPLSDTMPDPGSRMIYRTNDSLASAQGFARVGFKDGVTVAGSGFLFGDQFTHHASETNYVEYITANAVLDFETVPEQPLQLNFILQTSAEIYFRSDGSEATRDAEARSEVDNLGFTITATDPDNPSAVINIEYFIPTEGSGGFTI